ncbi:MAG: hypothetical protein HZA34_03170 [Candidatus Pacebacteria bacterium]|nr:hypothetical protein [Candidatus Paceibacterota bacterium]
MTFSSAPVVGAPDSQYWPQVFQYSPEESRVFIVAFCVQDGENTREKGRVFIEKLQKLSYSRIEDLSTALQRTCTEFHNYLESFTAAYIDHELLYLWSMGNGKVHLQRGQKYGCVVDSQEFRVIGGRIHQGDVLILGTKGFFTAVPHIKIHDGATAEEIADTAVITLQKSAIQSTSAAYVLQVVGQEEERSKKKDVIESIVPIHQEVPTTPPLPPHKQKKLLSRDAIILLTTNIFQGVLRQSFLPRIFVHSFSEKRKKTVIALSAGILFAVLVLVIAITRYQNNQRKAIDRVVTPYQQRLTSAQGKQSEDMIGARQETQQVVNDSTAELHRLKPRSTEYNALRRFVTTAEQYYATISGEKKLDSLPLFYNFQLVKSSFIAKKSATTKNTAVFLDPEGTVIQMNLQTKQPTVLEAGSVTALRDIGLRGNVVVLFGVGNSGILGLYESGKSLGIEVDDRSGPSLFRLFGLSAYVYMKGDGSLMKYPSQGSGYGAGKNWLKSAPGLDRNDVTSLVIDGKVWIGTAKGEIFSFAQGTKLSFSPKGMLTPFSSSIMLYTTPDLPNLYVLEPNAQRLVVLDKNGVYQKQIISKDIATTTDLFVSDDGKTAYLLAGSLVYSVNLE